MGVDHISRPTTEKSTSERIPKRFDPRIGPKRVEGWSKMSLIISYELTSEFDY